MYTISVKSLCAFTARAGDLDLRYAPSPSAAQGREGHRVVSGRRSAAYEREVWLATELDGLRVQGRADGFDPSTLRLEEVKTYRGSFERLPAAQRALHQAQADTYAHLLCLARGYSRLDVAIVYFDIATGDETVQMVSRGADELATIFAARCGAFRRWAEQESAHRRQRDAALSALKFPFEGFRDGQRLLAKRVYRTMRDRGQLLAQAPTGIGKTMATLFPALKACVSAADGVASGPDRLLYLTARTTGRAVALRAFDALRGAEPSRRLPLRVVELVARDKSCLHPGKGCHGDDCPLARGFWDRLPAARRDAVAALSEGETAQGESAHIEASAAEALQTASTQRSALHRIAAAHHVCPYHLSVELARWADVIVADLNYWFDTSALLYALAIDNDWRPGLLIDEAHNLVDRARTMYSATLDAGDLRKARAVLPAQGRRAVDRLRRQIRPLAPLAPALRIEHASPPQTLQQAVRELATTLGEWLAEPAPLAVPSLLTTAATTSSTAAVTVAPASDRSSPVLDLYFALLHWQAIADAYGPHACFDVETVTEARHGSQTMLHLRNLVPAPHLAPRFAQAHGVTLFSATLQCPSYQRDLLGLASDCGWLDVPSPFGTEQLTVRIARHISTRWRDRQASLVPIVDEIVAQYQRQPGNYLAFFSSFDYLDQVAQSIEARAPQVPIWLQTRAMDEAARDRFLARFERPDAGVAFAVLGGVFAEGIDLPGDRLIGAFIATLGLPQVNERTEQLRRRLDGTFNGAGYDYAYLYPGLQKVAQAAGRIIRTSGDRGTLVLLDDRYASPRLQRLLPDWWRPQSLPQASSALRAR